MGSTMTSHSDYIPWCYMPPETHFGSPQELKEAVCAFSLSRLQEELDDEEMARLFLPPNDRFEKVRNKRGEYILLPTALDLSFVYRGQTAFYDECLPTLYRKKELSEVEELIERLRCCEFEEYLRQLPEVSDFEQHRLKIDYLGLAQHYGLKTDVIDLTNSLDVALFFAMCNMSADGKRFYPQTEDREHIGYIYAVSAFATSPVRNGEETLYDDRLGVIGLQPFYRPGSQRGFGLHLHRGQTLTGLLYSFSYTRQDSESIYQYFNQGTTLWHDDEISRIAGEIQTTKRFSYAAMNRCFKRYFNGLNRERQTMIARMRALGCEFHKRSLWKLTDRELWQHREAYRQNGGFDGLNKIVQRRNGPQGGPFKHCMNTHTLAHIWMLRFAQSGCPAPEGYIPPFEYQESDGGATFSYSVKTITQAEQTKPNPVTHKVDKWQGDWRTLPIDYRREKKLKPKIVKVKSER